MFEQTFRIVASVVPALFRSCTWIWSKVILSAQCGWYQNVSSEFPAGTTTPCVSVLLPLNAVGDPIRAE